MGTVLAGYALLILYASLSFMSCEKGTGMRYSRMGIGFMGVMCVALSVAAGLGLCAYAGVKMNATSTQVLPFLLLGLGVDDMFVLVHKFRTYKKGLSAQEATGLAMSVAGPSITLTSATNVAAFFIARLGEMPVITDFATQAGTVIAINYLMMMLVLPSLLFLDYKRQENGQTDVLCCMKADGGKRLKRRETGVGALVVGAFKESLAKKKFQVGVMLVFIALLAFCLYGLDDKSTLGIYQKEIAPKDTPQHTFLDVRFTDFSMYTFDVCTGKTDWSKRENQFALIKLRKDLEKEKHVLDGDATRTWLEGMINFYVNPRPLYFTNETKFDGCRPQNVPNTSLLYFPESIFYDCLEEWVTGEGSQDTFLSVYGPTFNMTKSGKIKRMDANGNENANGRYLPFSSFFMFATNLLDNQDYIDLIEEARSVCDGSAFTKDTTPKPMPIGIPFRFWEQYRELKDLILSTVAYSLAAAFVCTWFILFVVSERGNGTIPYRIGVSAWAALIVTFIILVIVSEVAGLLAWSDISFSAIPAVSLIMCAGVGVEFTAHLVLAFLIATGTMNERMQKSLDIMFVPTFDGFVSTFLGVLILAFTEFEFIFRYFFLLYLIIVLVSVLNGLVVLPVILALFGPPGFDPENGGGKNVGPQVEDEGNPEKQVDML